MTRKLCSLTCALIPVLGMTLVGTDAQARHCRSYRSGYSWFQSSQPSTCCRPQATCCGAQPACAVQGPANYSAPSAPADQAAPAPPPAEPAPAPAT